MTLLGHMFSPKLQLSFPLNVLIIYSRLCHQCLKTSATTQGNHLHLNIQRLPARSALFAFNKVRLSSGIGSNLGLQVKKGDNAPTSS